MLIGFKKIAFDEKILKKNKKTWIQVMIHNFWQNTSNSSGLLASRRFSLSFFMIDSKVCSMVGMLVGDSEPPEDAPLPCRLRLLISASSFSSKLFLKVDRVKKSYFLTNVKYIFSFRKFKKMEEKIVSCL